MLENATLLTSDYLKNEMNYTLDGASAFQREKFRDYYLDICSFVRANHYTKPTMAQIEEYLTTGSYTLVNADKSEEVISCPIAEESERKYLFMRAMGKQLIYDMLGGRANMFRGESKADSTCRDMVALIKQLGLFQRTPFSY